MKNNIVLIGYMGCGKSSVGQYLSEHMNYVFTDTDQEIEHRAKCTISDIFAEKGEETFREMETELIRKMEADTEKCIVSTGGGLPLRSCNGEILKRLGFVIYLKVRKETVLKRLEGDTTRPLLQGDNVEEKVEQMLAFRNPIYEYTAHMVIDTDEKTIEEIGEEIIRNFQMVVKQG